MYSLVAKRRKKNKKKTHSLLLLQKKSDSNERIEEYKSCFLINIMSFLLKLKSRGKVLIAGFLLSFSRPHQTVMSYLVRKMF